VFSQREGHHAIITGEDLMKMIRVNSRESLLGALFELPIPLVE
jgi:hypothetical protein